MRSAREHIPFCRIRKIADGWSVERVYLSGEARIVLPHCRHFDTAIKVGELLDAEWYPVAERRRHAWPGRWRAWTRRVRAVAAKIQK